MTAATPGPSGPNIFSMFSGERDGPYRNRRGTFLFSLMGQAVVVAVLAYFTTSLLNQSHRFMGKPPRLDEHSVVFSGYNGGGGGNFDPMPASPGNLPKASVEDQLTSPTVMQPKQMPRLPEPETVMIAPDVQFPQGGQIGDPMLQFSRVLSNGPGGPGGIGPGCCHGVGPSKGPAAGIGPGGTLPAGIHGVTVPQVIYNPEPSVVYHK